MCSELNLIECRLADSVVLDAEESPSLFHVTEDLSQRYVGSRQLVVQHILMMFTKLWVNERISHKLLQ